MLQAELNGKIPSSIANSEDLLTSSIMGSIRYLKNHRIIQDIMAVSTNVNHRRLFMDKEITDIVYYFWPKLENSEPDLIIVMNDVNNRAQIYCIEAKYFSGKSSDEDVTVDIEERKNFQRDQLARQVEDLHLDSTYHLLNIKRTNVEHVNMIYLTNDTYIPAVDIEKSYESIQRIDFNLDDMYWLSWKGIYNEVKKNRLNTVQDQLIINDILKLLEKKSLVSFAGFVNLNSVDQMDWRYSTSRNIMNWMTHHVEDLNWKYKGDKD